MKRITILLLLLSTFLSFPQTKKITIAVLYFENNSIVDKEKLNGLSKGLADMLITELTQIKAFKVVERERLNDVLDEIKLSQSGAIDPSTAQKVGKLLGAQTLLLGSFMNSVGGQMRVDLRIVETETALTLKAEEVTDDIDALFDIVKDLAQKVTEEMDIKLTADEENNLKRGKFNVGIESSLSYSQAVNFEDAARKDYMSGNKESALSNYQKAAELYQLSLKNNDPMGKLSKVNGLIDAVKAPDITYERTFPPSITIVEPKLSEIAQKENVIAVKFKVEDLYGISNVFLNGNKVDKTSGGEYLMNVQLTKGVNELNIAATNGKGVTGNKTITVFVPEKVPGTTLSITKNEDDIISSGKYYALVIGINSYSGYWPPLRNAVNDAKGMSETLKNDYTIDTVIALYDKEATRQAIIEKLEWLANNLSKEDNLVIFYSGHGQLNKILNKGYWVPVDAVTNSVAGYISNNDIKTFIGGIQSKHTLLITDACFAGDIFRGGLTEQVNSDPNNMEKYYKEVYRKQSRSAITSGGLEQVADAGIDNHSIFTYYLLKTLKENNNKFIDASQLFNEFKISVTNNSEQTPQLQSVKDTNDEGGQFIFIRKL